jgi:hypothetical protein
VPRNTCGNGVLEPGEDCDSSAATCVRCAVTCTTATDCPSAAYACGVDGFCHAPGGALASPVEAGSFLVDDYRITDIDRDRIGDVVGLSRTSIVVRHGDAAASLTRTDVELTPSQTGPGAFGDVDNDGSLDVTIATAGGLVSYASTYGTLSPLDIASTIVGSSGQPVDVRMGFPISPITLGAYIAVNGQVLFGVVDFGNVNSINALPCGTLTPQDFAPDLVDVYQVNADADTSYDTVVAMTSHTGKLCVFAVHKDNILATPTLTDITPASNPTVTVKPVLADLDNDTDHCPDVITSDNGAGAMRHWAGTMSGGHCILQPALPNGDPLPAITGAPATEHAVGHATFSPGALGAVPDALVMPDGVWAYNGSAWGQVYASPRSIARAINTDLDGDGMNDVMLSAQDSNNIDVLYRSSSLFATFLLYRVDTATKVTTMATGDFDGDGIKDLEYTEQLADHERMMIAYGENHRLGTPIEVATFKSINSVARLTFPTSTSPSFSISDLIVLQTDGTSAPTITFLIGNPQRVMLPFLDPRKDNSVTLRAPVIGKFSGGTYNDVLAFGSTKPGTSPIEMRAWSVAGPLTAFDGTDTLGTVVSGVTDCSHDGGSGFCGENASYIALPAGSRATVLGIDDEPTPRAVMIDPTTFASTPVTALAPPANTAVHTLATVDLADGPALLAAYRGDSASALFVCKLDASGAPTTCSDIASVVGMPCTDLSAGHVTLQSTSQDLVALCRDGSDSVLFRVTDDGGTFAATELGRTAKDLRSLRIGDVDGDGLDDIVAVAGEPGVQTLVVFPQCSSRELATCGAHP